MNALFFGIFRSRIFIRQTERGNSEGDTSLSPECAPIIIRGGSRPARSAKPRAGGVQGGEYPPLQGVTGGHRPPLGIHRLKRSLTI